MKRSLIDITEFSVEEIDELLKTACDISEHPEKYWDACAHKKLATLFFEPSTRTRLSFEAAMLELGIAPEGTKAEQRRRVKEEMEKLFQKQNPQTETTRNILEAEPVVEGFLDNCRMSGLTTVSIIHGKGTGTLRKNVQAHLRHHRNIKTFRVGLFGEGENGVTIAEISD